MNVCGFFLGSEASRMHLPWRVEKCDIMDAVQQVG